MCLLDEVVRWDAAGIVCTARSHLDPANPLRRGGRLGIVCAAEYAMQAAAAHGTLTGGAGRAPGFAASLRGVRFGAGRLDDVAFGTLAVTALREGADGTGFVYALSVRAEDGRELLGGRAAIVLPGGGRA